MGGDVANKVAHVTWYEVIRPYTPDKLMVTAHVSHFRASSPDLSVW